MGLVADVGYLTVDQVDGAVGEARQRLVVGDDDERLAKFVAQVEEELVEFLIMGVETAGGFVGQNNVGLVHQGTGYGYALLSRHLRVRRACGRRGG